VPAAARYSAGGVGGSLGGGLDGRVVAGGLAGRPRPVVNAVSQPLLVPAHTEIVLEGRILPDETVTEGPFGEFVGYLSAVGQAPVTEITAVTHRRRPIYHAINGYGRETVVLRKYVLEASLLKVLQAAVPIVVDAEMTAGGLHRFHAVVQVRKTSPQHDGLQRNGMLAAFGALKELDLVIVVDDDSPDGTWRVAQRLAEGRPHLRVIRRIGRTGLSSAVIEGFLAAKGDVLAVADADGQHDPAVASGLNRAALRAPRCGWAGPRAARPAGQG